MLAKRVRVSFAFRKELHMKVSTKIFMCFLRISGCSAQKKNLAQVFPEFRLTNPGKCGTISKSRDMGL
jgi:hypothetical protein